jgi:hypothetical protein
MRPCGHCICRKCGESLQHKLENELPRCVRCDRPVDRLVAVSGGMNIPGQESLDVNIPVKLIEVGRDKGKFKSVLEEEEDDDDEEDDMDYETGD